MIRRLEQCKHKNHKITKKSHGIHSSIVREIGAAGVTIDRNLLFDAARFSCLKDLRLVDVHVDSPARIYRGELPGTGDLRLDCFILARETTYCIEGTRLRFLKSQTSPGSSDKVAA